MFQQGLVSRELLDWGSRFLAAYLVMSCPFCWILFMIDKSLGQTLTTPCTSHTQAWTPGGGDLWGPFQFCLLQIPTMRRLLYMHYVVFIRKINAKTKNQFFLKMSHLFLPVNYHYSGLAIWPLIYELFHDPQLVSPTSVSSFLLQLN